MILEIVAGILGFVFRDDLGVVAADRAADAIDRYRADEDDEEFREDVNTIVDFLQNRVCNTSANISIYLC